jgi:hypothetical protein
MEFYIEDETVDFRAFTLCSRIHNYTCLLLKCGGCILELNVFGVLN